MAGLGLYAPGRLQSPENRLGVALLISALLHGTIAMLWRQPMPASRLGPSGTLTVRFQSEHPAAAPSIQQERSEGVVEVAAVVAPLMMESLPSQATTAQIQQKRREEIYPQPPGELQIRPNTLKPGTVRVRLLINETGYIHQVIWDQLPAMTGDALDQLERRIRLKSYPATGQGYTVTEIIEVRP